MSGKRNPVYSTDPAFKKRCPRCGSYPCRCPAPRSLSPQQQSPRVFRERKGRGGKTVTVIRDLQLAPDDLTALCTQLKKQCGAGDAVKDGHIEIQGDHREAVLAALQALGYQARPAGG